MGTISGTKLPIHSDKKCQGQSFVNNETIPDDTDEDDEYIFRQKLFSSIDKENSDT